MAHDAAVAAGGDRAHTHQALLMGDSETTASSSSSSSTSSMEKRPPQRRSSSLGLLPASVELHHVPTVVYIHGSGELAQPSSFPELPTSASLSTPDIFRHASYI